MEQSAFEKLTGPHLVRKFPTFYENLIHKILTPVLIPSQINPVRAPPPLSHLLQILGLPSYILSSDLPPQYPLCISPLSHTFCMPAHLNLHDLITRKKNIL